MTPQLEVKLHTIVWYGCKPLGRQDGKLKIEDKEGVPVISLSLVFVFDVGI